MVFDKVYVDQNQQNTAPPPRPPKKNPKQKKTPIKLSAWIQQEMWWTMENKPI